MIFKKLFSGDSVATSGGKCFKKLITEEPTESIVGTWVFNSSLSFTAFDVSLDYSFNITDGVQSGTRIQAVNNALWFYWSNEYGGVTQAWVYNFKNGVTNQGWNLQIVINDEITDDVFITWLKANATKQ